MKKLSALLAATTAITIALASAVALGQSSVPPLNYPPTDNYGLQFGAGGPVLRPPFAPQAADVPPTLPLPNGQYASPTMMTAGVAAPIVNANGELSPVYAGQTVFPSQGGLGIINGGVAVAARSKGWGPNNGTTTYIGNYAPSGVYTYSGPQTYTTQGSFSDYGIRFTYGGLDNNLVAAFNNGSVPVAFVPNVSFSGTPAPVFAKLASQVGAGATVLTAANFPVLGNQPQSGWAVYGAGIQNGTTATINGNQITLSLPTTAAVNSVLLGGTKISFGAPFTLTTNAATSAASLVVNMASVANVAVGMTITHPFYGPNTVVTAIGSGTITTSKQPSNTVSGGQNFTFNWSFNQLSAGGNAAPDNQLHFASTVPVSVGMTVSGNSCIPANDTVIAVTPTAVTLAIAPTCTINSGATISFGGPLTPQQVAAIELLMWVQTTNGFRCAIDYADPAGAFVVVDVCDRPSGSKLGLPGDNTWFTTYLPPNVFFAFPTVVASPAAVPTGHRSIYDSAPIGIWIGVMTTTQVQYEALTVGNYDQANDGANNYEVITSNNKTILPSYNTPTNAGSSGGTATLHFAAVPAWVGINTLVSGTNIPAGSVVTAVTSTSVDISNTFVGNIANGALIAFGGTNTFNDQYPLSDTFHLGSRFFHADFGSTFASEAILIGRVTGNGGYRRGIVIQDGLFAGLVISPHALGLGMANGIISFQALGTGNVLNVVPGNNGISTWSLAPSGFVGSSNGTGFPNMYWDPNGQSGSGAIGLGIRNQGGSSPSQPAINFYSSGFVGQDFSIVATSGTFGTPNLGTLTMNGGTLRINANIYAPNLVTSCTSQPTGTLWNNAGVVNVCP